MEQPSIEDIKNLDGMDFAILTAEQEAVWSFFFKQGRKMGVSLQRNSEAPQEELAKAASSQQYDEIVKRYPSRITVTVK